MRSLFPVPLVLGLALSACSAAPQAGPAPPMISTPTLWEATGGFQLRSVVALTATDVVWLVEGFDAGLTAEGQVMSKPKFGGPAVTIADSQPWPVALGLNGADVYWANRGLFPVGDGDDLSDGSIQQSIAGGAAATLDSDSDAITIMAVGAEQDGRLALFWEDRQGIETLPTGAVGYAVPFLSPGGSLALAVDGGDLYWVDVDGSVSTVPTSGGAPVALAPPCAGTRGGRTFMVTDATHVYWLDPCGSLNRVDKTGGGVTKLATQGGTSKGLGGGLAADDASLFWVEDDQISVVSKSGGEVAAIPYVPDTSYVGPGLYLGGIAVDDTFVYWADSRGIWRSAKP